jgi:asparagine synthase (glutamine-hydrolysing)
MRRLSIIDLTGGWQPFYSEDRAIGCVVNGEIYNFVELRDRLTAQGHRFASANDCETIVHLYEDRGLSCVEDLRGMFAFALWDGPRRRLLLARDRMGEKPLYLFETAGTLVFASELKSLLRSGLVPFELDPRAVNLYFHYQYVPEPATPIRSVRKLPAGSFLVVDCDPWTVREVRYWRMEDAPPLGGDAPSILLEELETATTLLLRADVPVGLALSGGLDSSAILSLAAPKYPATLHAFSVGYPGRSESDEREQARAFAGSLGVVFEEVELEVGEIVGFFPELVYLRDDPIADIAGHGYYAISRRASERGIRVLLQGQGGDELFWGYPWLRQAVLETERKARLVERGWLVATEYLRPKLPRGRGLMSRTAWRQALTELVSGWRRIQEDRGSPAGRMVFLDIDQDFRAARTEAPCMYGPAMESTLLTDPCSLFTFDGAMPPIEIAATALVCSTYLCENGIAQGDRLAMASSVELRLPFVDYRFVEKVIGLRKNGTDFREPPKAWLKAALGQRLPPELLNRPKRGFQPPVREWHQALFVAHGASLPGGYLVGAGILSGEGARRLASGKTLSGGISSIAFRALVLEQWCRAMSAQTPRAVSFEVALKRPE